MLLQRPKNQLELAKLTILVCPVADLATHHLGHQTSEAMSNENDGSIDDLWWDQPHEVC